MPERELNDCAAIRMKISSSSSSEPAASTSAAPCVDSTRSPLIRIIPINSIAASNTSTADEVSGRDSSSSSIPKSIFFTVESNNSTVEISPANEANQETCVTQLSDRQRFVIFFKILILYMIRGTPNQKERMVIHRNIKALVAECRSEGIGDGPMMGRLELKLRSYVGEHAWKTTQDLFTAFCRHRRIR